MNQVTVTIEKQKYVLKFGYGVLKRLGHHYNLPEFEQLGNYIDSLNLTKGIKGFAATDFIAQLILAAIQYNDAAAEVDPDVIVDELVFKNPETLEPVFIAFQNSFPNADKSVGKSSNITPQKKTRK